MSLAEVKPLKISVQDGKSCEKVLKIEIGGEDIQREYEQFYKEIAPKAKIPGFRPGKAPRDVLVMHFQEEARQEVLKHLLSHSFQEAVREKTLEPLGLPEIKEVNFTDQKLSYQAFVETRPKIKLSRVTGLSIKRASVEIKPEESQQALKRVQESLAQYKAVEDRPSALGDFLIADYVCSVDGKEADKRTGDWFELKKDEFLKGFSPQLVGLKALDEKEVSVEFPENFGRKELAGKLALFKVKVQEVKTKHLPELNDEMAKEAGEFKTLAELREKVEKDLREAKEHEVETQFEKALLEELVKHNKLELPERLVARRLARLVEDALQHTQRHGLSEGQEEETKKKLEAKLAPEARRQVHLAFLLDEIALREKVTVEEADFKSRFERAAAQYRQPVDVVEKYYREHEEAREGLQDQIRNEKVIEFIKQNAKSS